MSYKVHSTIFLVIGSEDVRACHKEGLSLLGFFHIMGDEVNSFDYCYLTVKDRISVMGDILMKRNRRNRQDTYHALEEMFGGTSATLNEKLFARLEMPLNVEISYY
jgi:hypothetical protein